MSAMEPALAGPARMTSHEYPVQEISVHEVFTYTEEYFNSWSATYVLPCLSIVGVRINYAALSPESGVCIPPAREVAIWVGMQQS